MERELKELLEYFGWALTNGNTLLHLAIIHDNIDLVGYLSISNGYDVDKKNSNGDTPLLLALKSNKFEAVKILLNVDADLCVIDKLTGNSALRILISKCPMLPVEFRSYYLKNLKRRNLNHELLIDLLFNAKCPFEDVYRITNDVEFIRKYLRRNPVANTAKGMKLAMEQLDYDNIELILCQTGQSQGSMMFYSELLHSMLDKKTKYPIRIFIERLVKWNVVRGKALEDVSFMFQIANLDNLKMLLESKIHVQVQDNFKIDLRTAIFGNRNVNAIKVVRNLHNFDVNSRGYSNKVALHFAVEQKLIANVKFLLHSGANPNLKDNFCTTPLYDCIFFYPYGMKNGLLLMLEYGSDVQTIDSRESTVFEYALKCPRASAVNLLIAQIALDHERGIPIKQAIQNLIDTDENIKIIYDACCQQLQLLKNREIVDTVTFFTLLTGKNENLCRFFQNTNSITLLRQFRTQHSLHPLYYATMKSKLEKSPNFYLSKCAVANIISEITGISIDYDHLIIRNIFQHLRQADADLFVNEKYLYKK